LDNTNLGSRPHGCVSIMGTFSPSATQGLHQSPELEVAYSSSNSHFALTLMLGMRWEQYFHDGIFGNDIFGIWVMRGTLSQKLLASLPITARPAKHDFRRPFASLSLPSLEMDIENMVF
jgi:hypothetical protein